MRTYDGKGKSRQQIADELAAMLRGSQGQASPMTALQQVIIAAERKAQRAQTEDVINQAKIAIGLTLFGSGLGGRISKTRPKTAGLLTALFGAAYVAAGIALYRKARR